MKTYLDKLKEYDTFLKTKIAEAKIVREHHCRPFADLFNCSTESLGRSTAAVLRYSVYCEAQKELYRMFPELANQAEQKKN